MKYDQWEDSQQMGLFTFYRNQQGSSFSINSYVNPQQQQKSKKKNKFSIQKSSFKSVLVPKRLASHRYVNEIDCQQLAKRHQDKETKNDSSNQIFLHLNNFKSRKLSSKKMLKHFHSSMEQNQPTSPKINITRRVNPAHSLKNCTVKPTEVNIKYKYKENDLSLQKIKKEKKTQYIHLKNKSKSYRIFEQKSPCFQQKKINSIQFTIQPNYHKKTLNNLKLPKMGLKSKFRKKQIQIFAVRHKNNQYTNYSLEKKKSQDSLKTKREVQLNGDLQGKISNKKISNDQRYKQSHDCQKTTKNMI